MFECTPIATCFVPKLETMTTDRGLESPRDIDEKVGAFDIVFVAEFSEKYPSESGRSA